MFLSTIPPKVKEGHPHNRCCVSSSSRELTSNKMCLVPFRFALKKQSYYIFYILLWRTSQGGQLHEILSVFPLHPLSSRLGDSQWTPHWSTHILGFWGGWTWSIKHTEEMQENIEEEIFEKAMFLPLMAENHKPRKQELKTEIVKYVYIET